MSNTLTLYTYMLLLFNLLHSQVGSNYGIFKSMPAHKFLGYSSNRN